MKCHVDSFYIDVQEVTIGQYKKFMEATGHQQPLYWQPELDRPEDPVVGVSWQDAAAYASWAGKQASHRGGMGICGPRGEYARKLPVG